MDGVAAAWAAQNSAPKVGKIGGIDFAQRHGAPKGQLEQGCGAPHQPHVVTVAARHPERCLKDFVYGTTDCDSQLV